MASIKFSVIIPVYNRTQEVQELLESLTQQTYRNFEVLVIDDGSTMPCRDLVNKYQELLQIRYHFKENTGPGDSRNVGMRMANGEYVVLFDSDCLIPSDYFQHVVDHLDIHPLDAFGGPDDGHASFSATQKAINHAMTSFITTGGIRGKKKQLDKFQPRSFNMGVKKSVLQDVGGFSDIHPGEDPDLSYRIMAKGYRVGLISSAKVYHKRRIDFRKFAKQVYRFGLVRFILGRWHPGTLKLVYFLPTLFLLGAGASIVLAIVLSPAWLIPLTILLLAIFFESLVKAGNPYIALLSVLAALVQLFGYGAGFLNSFVQLGLLGGDERQVFPSFFFADKFSGPISQRI
ncbi:MAG: glycosyltransferase [Saprospiraceae bacterium]|nr:glycosyltransferase [Saprospiraceae bacterium]